MPPIASLTTRYTPARTNIAALSKVSARTAYENSMTPSTNHGAERADGLFDDAADVERGGPEIAQDDGGGPPEGDERQENGGGDDDLDAAIALDSGIHECPSIIWLRLLHALSWSRPTHLGAPPHLQAYRRAEKAELLPDAVDDEALVGEVECRGHVGE